MIWLAIAFLVVATYTYPHWSFKRYHERMRDATNEPFEGGEFGEETE